MDVYRGGVFPSVDTEIRVSMDNNLGSLDRYGLVRGIRVRRTSSLPPTKHGCAKKYSVRGVNRYPPPLLLGLRHPPARYSWGGGVSRGYQLFQRCNID